MHNLKLFATLVLALMSSFTAFVSAQCTISRTSAASTENQVLCVNSAIDPVIYDLTGASGAIVSNLPAGVTYAYVPGSPATTGTLTISGAPIQAGSFNFSITPIGCAGGGSNPTANGSIGVTSNNSLFLSSAVGTNAQTRCLNVPINTITYRAVGATNATVVGLPSGITGSWNALTNTLTISGAPDSASPVAYTLTYTVSMTGGCVGGNATQSGTITVNPAYSLNLVSSAASIDQNDICIGIPMDTIQFTTRGANSASFFGLPPGVTGLWRNDSVLIYGNPSVRGTYIFSFNLTGGPCNTGTRTFSDTLIVNGNTWELISAPSTANQTRCVDTPIDTIIYRRRGATSGTLSGAGAGLSFINTNDSLLIVGIPTSSGPYTYSVTGVGGCPGSPQNIISGVLNIRPTMTITNPGNDSQTVCRGQALANIQFNTVGATSVIVTGLPAGVTSAFSGSATSGTVTISGTPVVRGIFPFRIRLLGGCNPSSVVGGTGLITVNGNTAILNRKSSTVDGPEVLTTTQTRCVGKAIQPIVVSTTGYNTATVLTSGNTFDTIPRGTTATHNGNVTNGTLTISGIPTRPGQFTFRVRLSRSNTGPAPICTGIDTIITGTITVLDTINWTLTSASNSATLNQFSSLTPIIHTGNSSTNGAIFSGLPSGLIGSWNSSNNTATIFGTPTVTGIFNYRIAFTGRCMNGLSNVASGTITVTQPGTLGDNGADKMVGSDVNQLSMRSQKPTESLPTKGLVLYPVPSTDLLNVRGLDIFRKAKLTIVDQTGRELSTRFWMNSGDGAGELKISLEGYSSGVYFLHISETEFDYLDDLRERSSVRVMRFQIK